MSEAFVNEDNYTVWSDLSLNLSSVALLLQYTDAYPEFKTYVLRLFSNVAATVGWDPKPEESMWNLSLQSYIFCHKSVESNLYVFVFPAYRDCSVVIYI